ncbi:hypothetical protein J6590_047146 [Homalodisca vitripennis]|nr:hypothetical protein J6590_047146 [Homalodisca vitripennis]
MSTLLTALNWQTSGTSKPFFFFIVPVAKYSKLQWLVFCNIRIDVESESILSLEF